MNTQSSTSIRVSLLHCGSNSPSLYVDGGKSYKEDSFSKEISVIVSTAEREGLMDSESDISAESVAEKKIQKIDKKLNRHKQMDKAEKRRLQNRKSALKCRLRKSHTIQSLSVEV
jgi:F0F1-type ATP synthase epsilon subunit